MNRCKDCSEVHNGVKLRPLGFPLVDQRPFCDQCWTKRLRSAMRAFGDELKTVEQARKENA